MAERSEVRTPHAQAEHLLAGVGARIRKTCLDRNEQSALATAINEELCTESVKIERGRQTSATVRVLLRFSDDEGNRDSDEKIRDKLAIFTRHVMRATETRQFYSTSPAMRLLAMAVTERSREQSRAIREAAHEATMMRRQMQRLHLNGEQVEQPEDLEGDQSEHEPGDEAPGEQRAA